MTLIEKAIDRLRHFGWHQGSLGPVTGPNCLLGALWHERELELRAGNLKAYREFDQSVEAVLRHLQATGELGGLMGPAEWNDVPGRSVDEVLLVLREAHVILLKRPALEAPALEAMA